MDAVIAADEAPDEQRDTPEDEGLSWDYDEEKHHIDHIYKTLNASFSLSEIHTLFHDSNGLPIMLSDGEVDAAIDAHFPADAKVIIDCERHFPNCGSPRFIERNEKFKAHNVSSAQRRAAMQTEDPKVPTELSDAQVDAIVAADEASFDQGAADRKASSDQDADGEDDAPYDFEQDVRHMKHIYRTLNASFSPPEIHELFHNNDGLPIMLSDGEVDAAIAAHAANTARTVKRDGIVDCEAHFPNCDSPRSIKISETFMAHNLTVYQRLAALMTELDATSDTDLTDAQVERRGSFYVVQKPVCTAHSRLSFPKMVNRRLPRPKMTNITSNLSYFDGCVNEHVIRSSSWKSLSFRIDGIFRHSTVTPNTMTRKVAT